MISKFENYVNIIIERTGFSRSEILILMEEKKAELKDLISDEAALFIIAKENGININENVEISIMDITQSMRTIVLYGRVKLIYPIHSFENRNGELGFFGIFILHDHTGDIRVIAWNDHIKLFEQKDFRRNTLVKILSATAKYDRYNNLELHLGRFSRVILNPEDIDPKKYPIISETVSKVSDIKSIDEGLISLEGKIVQIFPITKYETFSGKVSYIISIDFIDDSGMIKITFWGKDSNKIQNFKPKDNIKITNLITHRNRVNNLIELYATPATRISISEKDVCFKLEYFEKVSDLNNIDGLTNFKGYISNIDNIVKIRTKSGRQNYFLNFFVGDEKNSIRITIYGESAFFYYKILKLGCEITLQNVLVKYNKKIRRHEAIFLNCSSLEINTTSRKPILESSEMKYSSIVSIKNLGYYKIKGFISKVISKIYFYEACGKCNKKFENCNTYSHKKERPITRMIINMMIDDETASIRTAFIGNIAEKLLRKKTQDVIMIHHPERYLNQLIGKNIVLTGPTRFNDYTGQYELIVKQFYFVQFNSRLNDYIKTIYLSISE
ncbi:MAG: DUF2240 family protein [Promethearchaeota archaeon]|nr:MAG: DUF2240 family protein [Candidatus Lokiarchaeota archaeon]